MKIAVLLTCHNRKDKTISSLKSLFQAVQEYKENLEIKVYLTDDASTDGTKESVSEKYPQVQILSGTGNLFWANGMINSWNQAVSDYDYDGYLLLNDDTNVFSSIFKEISDSNKECLSLYNTEGVYVGTTIDDSTKKITYGGSLFTNKFLYTYKRLIPNGKTQKCHLGNANIMYVSKNAYSKVGGLSKGYAHGVADYDYTLKCIKKNIPVLIMPNINGYCDYDHSDLYHNFDKKSLKERIAYLKSPLGIDFKSRLLYMRKFFPLRFPLFYIVGYLKVFFPKFYVNRMTKR